MLNRLQVQVLKFILYFFWKFSGYQFQLSQVYSICCSCISIINITGLKYHISCLNKLIWGLTFCDTYIFMLTLGVLWWYIQRSPCSGCHCVTSKQFRFHGWRYWHGRNINFCRNLAPLSQKCGEMSWRRGSTQQSFLRLPLKVPFVYPLLTNGNPFHLPTVTPRGGYSREFWIGVCRRGSWTPTLFKD